MKTTRLQRLTIITQGMNQVPRSDATELAADCNELEDHLAEALKTLANISHSMGQASKPGNDWRREVDLSKSAADAFLTKYEGLSK